MNVILVGPPGAEREPIRNHCPNLQDSPHQYRRYVPGCGAAGNGTGEKSSGIHECGQAGSR